MPSLYRNDPGFSIAGSNFRDWVVYFKKLKMIATTSPKCITQLKDRNYFECKQKIYHPFILIVLYVHMWVDSLTDIIIRLTSEHFLHQKNITENRAMLLLEF